MIINRRIILPLLLAMFFVSCSNNIARLDGGFRYGSNNGRHVIDSVYDNYPVQMFEPDATYDSLNLEENVNKILREKRDIIDRILFEARDWKYTPYRLGGNNKNSGADCSAFAGYIMNSVFGIILARSTFDQKNGGTPISKKNLVAGDLVFFRTNGPNGLHVGIYLENNSFIHLSSKGGTRIQNINGKYWNKRYLGARRYIGVK